MEAPPNPDQILWLTKREHVRGRAALERRRDASATTRQIGVRVDPVSRDRWPSWMTPTSRVPVGAIESGGHQVVGFVALRQNKPAQSGRLRSGQGCALPRAAPRGATARSASSFHLPVCPPLSIPPRPGGPLDTRIAHPIVRPQCTSKVLATRRMNLRQHSHY